MPREGQSGWTRTLENYVIKLPTGTSAAEFVTDLVPGFVRYLESASVTATVVATGSSATRVIRVVKGASTVVATLTLPLADASTLGEQQAMTVNDDSKTNLFEDGDTLTIDTIAAGATAFTAGELIMTLVWRTKAQQL